MAKESCNRCGDIACGTTFSVTANGVELAAMAGVSFGDQLFRIPVCPPCCRSLEVAVPALNQATISQSVLTSESIDVVNERLLRAVYGLANVSYRKV